MESHNLKVKISLVKSVHFYFPHSKLVFYASPCNIIKYSYPTVHGTSQVIVLKLVYVTVFPTY